MTNRPTISRHPIGVNQAFIGSPYKEPRPVTPFQLRFAHENKASPRHDTFLLPPVTIE
jgi:hypothetical protein